MDLMSRESASLDREFKMIEESFGSDHLDLVLTIAYLRKLVENVRIARYLERSYEDIFAEFRRLAETGQAIG